MKKLIFFLFALVLFVSCSSESENAFALKADVNSCFVPKDTAIELANKAMSSLRANLKTRSAKEFTVKDVSLVNLEYSSIRTRVKDDIVPNVYVINYENNGGFAIVSGDKRLRPIYAISDSGSVNMMDTINNKGLALFFDGVREDAMRVSSKKTTIYRENNKNYIINAQVPPLLTYGTRRWGQLTPYNANCPLVDGGHAPVGCTAVAVGQILSYYNWPQSINDYTYSWRAMNAARANNMVAKLFGVLGSKKVLNMKYGKDGSVAKIDSIMPAFQKLGYLKPNKFKGFSVSDICEILDNAAPDIVVGDDEAYGPVLVAGTSTNASEKGAHIWVIDGYVRNPYYEDGTKLESTLFHCVWGYNDGEDNGYYYFDGKIGGSPSFKDINDKIFDNEMVYFYKGLLYMTNFRKDKERGLTGNIKL